MVEIEDWEQNFPKTGIREMCTWERFCTFSREPEQRKVGSDARVSVEGVTYQLSPELAGFDVILWWGVFDNELFVEYGEKKYGPFTPVEGPISMDRFRSFKKTSSEKRADRIENIAKTLELPKTALTEGSQRHLGNLLLAEKSHSTPFEDPDPFEEFSYPSILEAKWAISDFLGKPLAKLEVDQLNHIDDILNKTLDKSEVMEQVKRYFG